jgi:hypothetical protein
VAKDVTMRKTSLAVIAVLTLSVVGFAQSTVQSVDFNNFSYPWSNSFDAGLASVSTWKWMDVRGVSRLDLQKGFHSFGPTDGYLRVESVTYGDLDGDGRDDAAIDLTRGSGGSANWHYVYIFGDAKSAPKLLGILRSGSRANGGLTAVAITGRVLNLEFNDPALSAADCCSKGFIRVQYKYDGTHFIEAAPPVKGLRKN